MQDPQREWIIGLCGLWLAFGQKTDFFTDMMTNSISQYFGRIFS